MSICNSVQRVKASKIVFSCYSEGCHNCSGMNLQMLWWHICREPSKIKRIFCIALIASFARDALFREKLKFMLLKNMFHVWYIIDVTEQQRAYSFDLWKQANETVLASIDINSLVLAPGPGEVVYYTEQLLQTIYKQICIIAYNCVKSVDKVCITALRLDYRTFLCTN